ncbi:MAG: hypothetical protein M3300_01120, partial [Actinomycetota bacterium]|nr:hypothetical protein [Actinomycetota bacterium]
RRSDEHQDHSQDDQAFATIPHGDSLLVPGWGRSRVVIRVWSSLISFAFLRKANSSGIKGADTGGTVLTKGVHELS